MIKEIFLENYLSGGVADNEITHYAMSGTVRPTGGRSSGVKHSILVVSGERYEQLIRYDDSGLIRVNFDLRPVEIRMQGLAPRKSIAGGREYPVGRSNFELAFEEVGYIVGQMKIVAVVIRGL